jgi:ankyrin repeat protein
MSGPGKVERTEQKAYIPLVQAAGSGAVATALGAGAAGSAAGLSGRVTVTSGAGEAERVETLNFVQAVRGWQSRAVGAGQLGLSAGQDLAPAYEKRILQLYADAAKIAGVKSVEKPSVSDAVELLSGLEKCDSRGRNALHRAIGEGALESLEGLIRVGMDVNALTAEEHPQHPLELTLFLVTFKLAQSRAAMALLLKAGSRAGGWRDRYGHTLLYGALSSDVELAEQLLRAGANPDEMCQNGIWTPLINMTYHGVADRVRLLLKWGASVHLGDSGGTTALDYAVTTRHRSVEIIKMLLAQGADPTTKAQSGWTPLSRATDRGARDIVELFEKAMKAPPAGAGAGQQSISIQSLSNSS